MISQKLTSYLIYRPDISMIESNNCSHASCNFLKFLTWIVSSHWFPKMAGVGVKGPTAETFDITRLKVIGPASGMKE